MAEDNPTAGHGYTIDARTPEMKIDRMLRDNKAFMKLVYLFALEIVKFCENTYGFRPPVATIN